MTTVRHDRRAAADGGTWRRRGSRWLAVLPTVALSAAVACALYFLWRDGRAAGARPLASSPAVTAPADGAPEFAGMAVARTLAWIDRGGRVTSLGAPPRGYAYPRLSPDGARVALDIRDDRHGLWLWDLAARHLDPLSVGRSSDIAPVWSHDGGWLLFSRGRGVAPGLFRMLAGPRGPAPAGWRRGPVERLPAESNSLLMPSSLVPGGRYLLATTSVASGFDIVVVDLQGDGRIQPFVHGPADELNAEVSPDARWVAFQSRASGQFDIWLAEWTPPGHAPAPPRQLTTTGGTRPVWTRGGRELLYLTNDGAVMRLRLGDAAPRRLFTADIYRELVGRTFDVTADGERLLVVLDLSKEHLPVR